MDTNDPRPVEYRRGGYVISTDKGRLDLDVIHGFLVSSYWVTGITRQTVERAIKHSLCFGVFKVHGQTGSQVGFARVISDLATFAYIADVFILESHRGQGLGKWLIGCMLSHPDLQNLRDWLLATTYAQGLYSQFGFQPLVHPERWMRVYNPDVYKEQRQG